MTLHEFCSAEEIKKLVGATVTGVCAFELPNGDENITIEFESKDGTKHTIGLSGEDHIFLYGSDKWIPTSDDVLLVLNNMKEAIDSCDELGAEDLKPGYQNDFDELLYGEDKANSIISYLAFVKDCTPEEAIEKELSELMNRVLK